MNVWERIKKFINKIKGNQKEQLTLNEKSEIQDIVNNTKEDKISDLEEQKQKFVKVVDEESVTETYVIDINGWVENRLQQELRNVCINTALPTMKGEVIKKHKKRVEKLFAKALGEIADAKYDKYETKIENAEKRCNRRFIAPYLKKITGKIKKELKENEISPKDVTEVQLEKAFKNAIVGEKFIQDVTEKTIQMIDKGIVTFEIGNVGNIISIRFVTNEKLDMCYDDKAYTKKVTTIQANSGQSNIVEKKMTVIHKVTYGVSQAVLNLEETVDIRDEDGSFISNVCTKTHRMIESNETPEWIMKKYEMGVYKMDISDADYYTRDILANKDGDIVWKKITTKPGHENECKVVIYPDGNIGADEIKKENISADEVEGAWNALKKCLVQESLPMAE